MVQQYTETKVRLEDRQPFRATFYFTANNTIYGFEAKGEAFDYYGCSIVATAISVLILNAVNSLQEFTEDAAHIEREDGYIKCTLPNLQKDKGSREAAVILQSLNYGLNTLQYAYGSKFIQIKFIFDKKRRWTDLLSFFHKN
ncbi:ribosomal-processing cysteine protease Prp [Paenibacillus larvae]